MSDPKPASLQPVDEADVLALLRAVMGDHHPELADASIRLFWLMNKPLTVWGQTRVCTEMMWWLSGALDGADVVITLNSSLWGNLQAAGRRFVLDHRLSQVRPKEGGAEEMDTTAGVRRLYQIVRHDLGVSPTVIARNPDGFAQIAEMAKLRDAIRDPQQFLLDLKATKAAGDDDDGEGEGEDPEEEFDRFQRHGAPAPAGRPLVYYGTHRLASGLREGWLIYATYSGPEKTPAELTGVHFPADQSPDPANGPIDKGQLIYDCSPEAIATYRADLTRDLEERQREAIEASGGAVELGKWQEGEIVDCGEPEDFEPPARGEEPDQPGAEGDFDEEEFAEQLGAALDAQDAEPEGAEIVQMAGRRR